jgi:group I intron endonuclease
MNLYWIHHKDHTDIFSQGYVGVSNNVKKRWYDHKTYTENAHLKYSVEKYGWDNLVKEIVLIADNDYCLDIENKLRPNDKIGWNIVMGGGKPPSALGKKFVRSEKYKEKQRLAHIGRKSWNAGIKLTAEQKIKQFNLAEYMKDKVSPMKGKKHSEETKEKIRQTKLSQSRSKQCLA